MLLTETKKQETASVLASLSMTFALLGDTFLYPFLPLNSEQVGIPILWVGLILSANRFVRIFFNSLIYNFTTRYGMRTVTIVASIVAICSTIGYAVCEGVLIWLFFRIVWGLCYSALRITTIGYALEHPKQGLALGLTKSLPELGSIILLGATPFLLGNVSIKMIFVLIAVASLPALLFALKLPITDNKISSQRTSSILKFPSTFNALTFASTFLDSIVVLALGVLFLKYRESITPLVATALAAGYLAYRRVCVVVLSLVGGWLADKVGLEKVFNISMFLVIVGLLLLVAGYVEIGCVVIFTFFSINSVLTPGSVSQNSENPLSAVSENATWRDIGAAVGALAGGFLLTSTYLHIVLLLGTFGLLILFFINIGSIQKARKILYSWKS